MLSKCVHETGKKRMKDERWDHTLLHQEELGSMHYEIHDRLSRSFPESSEIQRELWGCTAVMECKMLQVRVICHSHTTGHCLSLWGWATRLNWATPTVARVSEEATNLMPKPLDPLIFQYQPKIRASGVHYHLCISPWSISYMGCIFFPQADILSIINEFGLEISIQGPNGV